MLARSPSRSRPRSSGSVDGVTDHEHDLEQITDVGQPAPELHELADAGATEADADAGHDPGHDSAGHDTHGDHEEHPAEDPRWVVPPLLVGMVIGLVILVILGLSSGATSII